MPHCKRTQTSRKSYTRKSGSHVKASCVGSKYVKAGTKVVSGRKRQLYRLRGKTSGGVFYRYKTKDGSMGKRYIK